MDNSADEFNNKHTSIDGLLTRREAAAYLGVASKTLAAWSVSGRNGLEIVRIGARLVRYRKADLDALILKHRFKPNGPGGSHDNAEQASF